MSLRTKIILIMLLGFVGLTAVVFTFARVSVDRAFDRLEKKSIGHDAAVIRMVYDHELELLAKTALEWTGKAAVHDVVNGVGEDLFKSGHHDGPLIQGRINLLMILDAKGQPVASRFFDLQERRAAPIPKSFLEFLEEDSFVRVHHRVDSRISGLLPLMEQPMILVSLPILPEEPGGLIQGTVIVGRWWSEGEFLRIAVRTGLSAYQQYTGDDLMADFADALTHLQVDERPRTVMLQRASVAAYILLNNIYGDPGLILRLKKDRDSFLASFAVSSRVGIFTVLAGFLFLILALILLEATTLGRMRVLVREIRAIESMKHIATAKVTVKGRDEVGRIAEGVRYVLSALKVNRFRWVRSERRLQSVIEALPVGVIFLDMQTHGIRRLNPRAIELLGSDAHALLGQPFEELVATEGGGHDDWLGTVREWREDPDPVRLSLRHPDGTTIQVAVTATEVSMDEGKLLIVAFNC